MQSSSVSSFRKRLQNRGYTQVSIFRCKDDTTKFIIKAVEPLSNTLVTSIYSIEKMLNSFR